MRLSTVPEPDIEEKMAKSDDSVTGSNNSASSSGDSATSSGNSGKSSDDTIAQAGTVTLHGSHDQYIIVNNNGSLYVQDTVAGRDGIQTLPGDREVVFTDGKGIFDPSGTGEDISRLYVATLGRGADDGGLEHWTDDVDNSHASLSQVAGSLATSPEFIHNFGSLSDHDFVETLYKNVLHRSDDTAGALFWDGKLATGTSRGDVADAFAQSPENRSSTVSTAGDDNDAEAYRLYTAALGRAPDQPGEDFWSAALANGATPTQVAQSFIGSPEFEHNFGGLSDNDFVSALYQNVLHRPGDDTGKQFWTSALQQGTSRANVVVSFSDSLENRVQTAGATHANWVFIPT
jgi:hypothetical protein